MRFKIDENLPKQVYTLLNEAGHDAETVYQEQLSGISDQDLFKKCNSEKRCLGNGRFGF